MVGYGSARPPSGPFLTVSVLTYCQADAFEEAALELGNHPFDFAASLKDEARIAKGLYEVAGSDKKLDAKATPALTSSGYTYTGPYSQALVMTRDFCCCLHLNNTTAFRAREFAENAPAKNEKLQAGRRQWEEI